MARKNKQWGRARKRWFIFSFPILHPFKRRAYRKMARDYLGR